MGFKYAIANDRSFAKASTLDSHFIVEGSHALKAKIDLSELIRELRGRTGLTQEKFAAKLGVTFPTINRWENGRTIPSPLAMQKLEDFMRKMGKSGKDLLESLLAEKKEIR
jgi:DNA-binding transcriptional regulator YiaG